ncbi:MAG: DnaJ domain-containing protein [Paludibacteraceae bacterium]|nr:DnaJ domain-containing protein [Paludibacteraceae bacterium]
MTPFRKKQHIKYCIITLLALLVNLNAIGKMTNNNLKSGDTLHFPSIHGFDFGQTVNRECVSSTNFDTFPLIANIRVPDGYTYCFYADFIKRPFDVNMAIDGGLTNCIVNDNHETITIYRHITKKRCGGTQLKAINPINKILLTYTESDQYTAPDSAHFWFKDAYSDSWEMKDAVPLRNGTYTTEIDNFWGLWTIYEPKLNKGARLVKHVVSVRDSSGNPFINTTLHLTDVNKGKTYHFKTNKKGEVIFYHSSDSQFCYETDIKCSSTTTRVFPDSTTITLWTDVNAIEKEKSKTSNTISLKKIATTFFIIIFVYCLFHSETDKKSREIAKRILAKTLRLNPELTIRKQELMKDFTIGINPNDVYRLATSNLETDNITISPDEYHAFNKKIKFKIRRDFVHLLFKLAAEDDGIKNDEWALIQSIMPKLGLNKRHCDYMTARYSSIRSEYDYHSNAHTQQAEQQHNKSAAGSVYSRYSQYFALFGLSPEATKDEVQQAYHKLAMEYHPDLPKNADRHMECVRKMAELNVAYTQLMKAM